jgi:DNA primase
MFSQLQSFINNEISTKNITKDDDLITAINNAIESVTKEQCANYYKHVNRFYIHCIELKPLDYSKLES